MGEYTKYTEIIENIKQKIQSNIYKSNELLPSEKELCTEYSVSRRTVRRAIIELVEDGYLYTVPGKGTFVHVLNKDNMKLTLDLETLFTRDLINQNYMKPPFSRQMFTLYIICRWRQQIKFCEFSLS